MSFNFGSSFPTPSTTTFSFSTNTQPKGFGQSGFGFGSAASTTSTATNFSFGTVTSTPSAGFGAVSKPITSTGFGNVFGSTVTTASTFSFGAPVTTTQSLFSFGTAPVTSSGFGGFGAGFGSSSGLNTGQAFNFGQPQQLQQQQSAPDVDEQFSNSIFRCNIYGDERDEVITKWNLLQAFWGFGKGYYAQNGASSDYTQQNPLCRLKTFAYSVKPKTSSSDALVAISFNKKAEEIKNQQMQLESSIANILGNKPNITVHVDCIRPSSDTKSLVLIYVQERTSAVLTKRIPQNEVCSYLLQPSPKQQLISMGVDNVYCFSSPKDEQIAVYLENPPLGIDPKIWKQAQDNNPNPSKFIPVPIIGLESLEWRLKCQENEMKIQTTLADNLSTDINNLQRQQNINNARINECDQTLLRLEHRVCKLFVELSKYSSTAFGPVEEGFKARLENLSSKLSKPQYFKNRVAEMLSAVRLHETDQNKANNNIDDETIKDIKEFLSMQINAINNLKEVVLADFADVKKIKEELKQLPPNN